jgi:putative NIF3 family GTP cyclohydrolase 1 type 2
MMSVEEIFKLGIKFGKEYDPRGVEGANRHLARVKKQFASLPPSEKEYFDEDRLTNPYPDCAVHVNDGKTKVKRVLAGIDITASDILLASQLNERGKKIDLVISHHPVGKALANLHEVMDMIVDVYEEMGIPVHIAEKMFEERVKEIGRGVHPSNHFSVVDVAKTLGINFMTTHTITDNMVNDFLIRHFEKTKPEVLGDIPSALLELEEFKIAKKYGAGPKIVAGAPHNRVGKWYVEMTGGTNPSAKVYEPLSDYGVSTVVGMHMKDDAIKTANDSRLNVVISGHMSSDSLGMNIWLDELEKKGIEVIPVGGLIRVSRNKKKR